MWRRGAAAVPTGARKDDGRRSAPPPALVLGPWKPARRARKTTGNPREGCGWEDGFF